MARTIEHYARTPRGEYDQIQFEGVLSGGIENPQGINTVVSAYRRRILAEHFGYTPALILDSKPNKYLTAGVEKRLVGGEHLPAAPFNRYLLPYPGTTANFELEPVEPDPAKMRVTSGIDLDVSTSFQVSADLISLGGETEGRIEREYTLYAVSPDAIKNTPIPLKLWRNIYSKTALHDQHVLLLQSININPAGWKQAIHDSAVRHEEAAARGQELARHATVYQGGLPGSRAR